MFGARNNQTGRRDNSNYRGAANNNRGYGDRTGGYRGNGDEFSQRQPNNRYKQQRPNSNQHDLSVVPNLVYVTNTTRVNMGKITKVSHDRMSGEWALHMPNGGTIKVNANDLNEGTKVILNSYYYLMPISNTEKGIEKINVNAIIKAKLDVASGIWYIDMAGGSRFEVSDSAIRNASNGIDFGGTSMVTVIDNACEVFRINKYFVMAVDRNEVSDNVQFTVQYNDGSVTEDVFLLDELTDHGLAAVARYRKPFQDIQAD